VPSGQTNGIFPNENVGAWYACISLSVKFLNWLVSTTVDEATGAGAGLSKTRVLLTVCSIGFLEIPLPAPNIPPFDPPKLLFPILENELPPSWVPNGDVLVFPKGDAPVDWLEANGPVDVWFPPNGEDDDWLFDPPKGEDDGCDPNGEDVDCVLDPPNGEDDPWFPKPEFCVLDGVPKGEDDGWFPLNADCVFPAKGVCVSIDWPLLDPNGWFPKGEEELLLNPVFPWLNIELWLLPNPLLELSNDEPPNGEEEEFVDPKGEDDVWLLLPPKGEEDEVPNAEVFPPKADPWLLPNPLLELLNDEPPNGEEEGGLLDPKGEDEAWLLLFPNGDDWAPKALEPKALEFPKPEFWLLLPNPVFPNPEPLVPPNTFLLLSGCKNLQLAPLVQLG